jgi:hypothetical protein
VLSARDREGREIKALVLSANDMWASNTFPPEGWSERVHDRAALEGADNPWDIEFEAQ